MNQVRLAKTPEIEKVFRILREKYHLLSEAEILKVALSEKYYREIHNNEKEQRFKEMYAELKSEGKKLGDKLLAKRGLKREDISEQEFYDLFLNPYK